MMDQIFCHHCLALTMARKCHSFCSAAVTLYTFCLRQTTAVPIMDSRFIMKVSNYKYSLFSHSAFYMLGIIFILLREVRYLLINSFKPKFLFINNKFKVKYITQLNSTMDFFKELLPNIPFKGNTVSEISNKFSTFMFKLFWMV